MGGIGTPNWVRGCGGVGSTLGGSGMGDVNVDWRFSGRMDEGATASTVPTDGRMGWCSEARAKLVGGCATVLAEAETRPAGEQ